VDKRRDRNRSGEGVCLVVYGCVVCVWMYFKRVYSGRNALDAGDRYKKLDLIFKFIVVYLSFTFKGLREVFFAIAAGIFFMQLVITLTIQPCGQKRGNIFHTGCLAVLTLTSLYYLAVTLELFSMESLEVGVEVGISGICMVTLAFMVLAKTPLSVVMQEAMGQSFHGEPLAERQIRYSASTPRLFTLFAVLFNLSLNPTINLALLATYLAIKPESVLMLFLAELPLMCAGASIGMLVQRPRTDRTDMVLIGLLGLWLGAIFFVQKAMLAEILTPAYLLVLLCCPVFTLGMYFVAKHCPGVTAIVAVLLMVPLLVYFLLATSLIVFIVF